MSVRILVVDDERNIRLMMEQTLALAGHVVDLAVSGEEAIEQLRGRPTDIVLLDVRLPGIDGLQTLAALLNIDPDLPIIMMSGHGTIETAVHAVRLGAVDFLEKPLSRDTLLMSVDNALKLSRLTRENRRLRTAIGEGDLIGDAPSMQVLREKIGQVAPTEATVLIEGESGSGKELVARALHRQSRRTEAPLIALNCAAIPSELLESELFGHTKGAFTGADASRAGVFEAAHGGTLFLDEIGDMPLAMQAKLLRVLESRQVQRVGTHETIKVDVRVVAATHRNLEVAVREDEFREDLYHRLKVVPLQVPPLRDRVEDIPVLAQVFLESSVARQKLSPRRFSAGALQALGRYPWPGNVRELRNLVERLAILSPHEEINEDFVIAELPSDGTTSVGGSSLKEIVVDCERRAIEAAVRGAQGNVAEAARRLGLERAHLYKKARAVGVDLSQR